MLRQHYFWGICDCLQQRDFLGKRPKIILRQQINSNMSCYLILRKWGNPQLPAKKQVFQKFIILDKSPYIFYSLKCYNYWVHQQVLCKLCKMSQFSHLNKKVKGPYNLFCLALLLSYNLLNNT